MIQNSAHHSSLRPISIFREPRIVLGYDLFDFTVEEAVHPGALELASPSSGFCEIADGRSPVDPTPELERMKREISKWDFTGDGVEGLLPLAELLEPELDAELRHARRKLDEAAKPYELSWAKLMAS